MAGTEQMAAVEKTLAALTLQEKITLLHGDFKSGGVPRLGIAPLMCADGPLGVRTKVLRKAGRLGQEGGEVTDEGLAASAGPKTALPATLGLAATFNVETAYRYASLIAREARSAGIHLMLAPGLNLMRDPRCGRGFEYLGEDPVLTSALGVAYIRGLQDQGVGGCAKHYYANDIEERRHQTSSNLDPRTAWEVHLRPFVDACTKAGVWTVMTGNNLVNGVHISQNAEELRGILRDRLGWDGVVLTDWRSAYTPAECIRGGTDMTTGFCKYVYGDEDLPRLLAEGTIPESAIDEMARRVLLLYARVGLLDEEEQGGVEPADPAGHRATARAVATEAMVLLKNAGDLLPARPGDVRRIVVVGPAADVVAFGRGSSVVDDPEHLVTPLAGLRRAYPDAEIIHAAAEDDELPVEAADLVLFFAVGPHCGEGFDIEGIRIDAEQERQINELGTRTKNLAVVL